MNQSVSLEGKREAEGLGERPVGLVGRLGLHGPQGDPSRPSLQSSPDRQAGPNRLGRHSWQAEPLKPSWCRSTPSQRGPFPVPTRLPGSHLAHAGPVPVYAIQAGAVAAARGLCPSGALCGPHPQ